MIILGTYTSSYKSLDQSPDRCTFFLLINFVSKFLLSCISWFLSYFTDTFWLSTLILRGLTKYDRSRVNRSGLSCIIVLKSTLADTFSFFLKNSSISDSFFTRAYSWSNYSLGIDGSIFYESQFYPNFFCIVSSNIEGRYSIKWDFLRNGKSISDSVCYIVSFSINNFCLTKLLIAATLGNFTFTTRVV